MHTNLHPVFAGILAGVAAAPAQLQRAEYLTLLRGQDWQFEFADSGTAYRAGRDTLARIRILQPVVDADRALFDAHRPAGHGVATL